MHSDNILFWYFWWDW